MGSMRQSDVPPCAIDFHVSNVIDDVLKGRASGSVRAKVLGAYAKHSDSQQPKKKPQKKKQKKKKKKKSSPDAPLDDEALVTLCRQAMWHCSSATNFRRLFPSAVSAQQGEGKRGGSSGGGSRMQLLQAVWAEMEPECERYATALVARRFEAGRSW
jgi:hypothetical protein